MTKLEQVKAALSQYPHLPHSEVDKIAGTARGYANRVYHRLTGAAPNPVKSKAGKLGNAARAANDLIRRAASAMMPEPYTLPAIVVGLPQVIGAVPVSPLPPFSTCTAACGVV